MDKERSGDNDSDDEEENVTGIAHCLHPDHQGEEETQLSQHQHMVAQWDLNLEDDHSDADHDLLHREDSLVPGFSPPPPSPSPTLSVHPNPLHFTLDLPPHRPFDLYSLSTRPSLYRDNNPDFAHGLKKPPLPSRFKNSFPETWSWSRVAKSDEVRLCSPHSATAFFHPNWSNGTAGVRANKALSTGLHYWEIRVASRVFGTSMMFGVATRKARMHAGSFLNLLGEDGESWGLSHRGLAWHGGHSTDFCTPFTENVAVTVGIVYDGTRGTLEYYKDGQSLGVAFTGLDCVADDLFPAVSSTAAKTEMTIGVTRKAFSRLQDHCRSAITGHLATVGKLSQVMKLPLPRVLCRFVREEASAMSISTSHLPPPPSAPPVDLQTAP